MKEIVLAGGCFWGVEEYFSRTKGITETTVGYANGETEKPSYDDVKLGHTGHAEACYVKFDENAITLEELLDRYWRIVDPLLLNQQGPDIGTQYRTGIYYIDEKDFETIRGSMEKEQKKYSRPIVTEIEPLKYFYPAEEYHQRYLKKNPGGYCHIKL